MSELQMPREWALAQLRPYVKRGDSYQNIRSGDMGWSLHTGEGEIRGARHEMVVTRIGPYTCGQVCHVRFKLRDLYNELKHEKPDAPKQVRLW